MSQHRTSYPYYVGASLDLQLHPLNNEFSSLLPKTASGLIVQQFTATMSPVVEVEIGLNSGPPLRAVLKIFDRRFGTGLRRLEQKVFYHTDEQEKAFQNFIRQGQADAFLAEYNRERETAQLSPDAEDYYEDTPDGHAKYEAVTWQDTEDYYENELNTYSHLGDYQGIMVPKLLASVSISPPEDCSNAEISHYSNVKGLLIELIPGKTLSELITAKPLLPSDSTQWSRIVQSVMDAMHKINQSGIVLRDCAARNVIIHETTKAPFIIDFAQCHSRERLIQWWRQSLERFEDGDEEEEEEEPWDEEVAYWERVRSAGNPLEIGVVMKTKLKNERGLDVEITYPDYNKIIEDVMGEFRGKMQEA